MSSTPATTLRLICGDDDFAVKQGAKALFGEWCAALGGMDHEILDASAGNSGEAMKVIGRLREALQTLPFFGNGKVVWLKDCNFLGEEKTASSKAVMDALGELAVELKEHDWKGVRLLISAGKADKRRVFYKTLEKLGTIETHMAWSVDGGQWVPQAEMAARSGFQKCEKKITEEALAELLARVGPNARQLDSEVEKLCLYVGNRAQVEIHDVTEACSRNKTARAFALGDALGERKLANLLKRLDEELWETKFDRDKSEIGLLYGLIGKIRSMILVKEMVKEGWIKPTHDYSQFKNQLSRVPTDQLPEDKKFNPLAINPYVLYKAVAQVKNYTSTELVRAMEILLRCNQRMVSSGLDESMLLQHSLVQIVSAPTSI